MRNLLIGLVAAIALSASQSKAQNAAPADSVLRAPGVQLRFRVSGDAAGPAVVLIHGYVGSLEEMDSVRAVLAPHYRVIQMDVRTFGQSTGPSPSAAAPFVLVDDVRLLLDRLHVRRAHLVGYSMGALMSARFAARYPDRVRSVTLVAPAPLKSGQRRGLLDSTAVALEHGHGIDPLIIAVNPPDEPLPSPADMAAINKDILTGHDSLAWAAVARNLAALQLQESASRALSGPMRMIIGARDPMLVDAREWLPAFPPIRVDTILRATHNDIMIYPELSRRVRDFLDSLPAEATSAPRPANEGLFGRWDITVNTPAGPRPSWLEIDHSGNDVLVGRFVGIAGSARPISRIVASGDSIRFAIPPQWEAGTGDLVVEGRLQGERLSGHMTFPDAKSFEWTGVRAPSLRHPKPPVWGTPIRLLHANDLTGWHAQSGENQWIVTAGVLRSPHSGANLMTERTFGDFKLHIEFRYPKGSNSGVYLRGRHEVQIEDNFGLEPASDRFSGVYGFIEPSEIAAKPAGEWQTYDITLVGRMVTVVANGRTVICNREIPGITGGAIDSDEGAPGPLLLQGDHGPIEYRNIVLTPGR